MTRREFEEMKTIEVTVNEDDLLEVQSLLNAATPSEAVRILISNRLAAERAKQSEPHHHRPPEEPLPEFQERQPSEDEWKTRKENRGERQWRKAGPPVEEAPSNEHPMRSYLRREKEESDQRERRGKPGGPGGSRTSGYGAGRPPVGGGYGGNRPPRPEGGGYGGNRPPRPEGGGYGGNRPPRPEGGGYGGNRPPRPEGGGYGGNRPPRPEGGGYSGNRPPRPEGGGYGGNRPPRPEGGGYGGNRPPHGPGGGDRPGGGPNRGRPRGPR